MEAVLNTIWSAQFAYSVLRVTTPILFAALAALITEKAGVLHIAFEGIMLFAALMGVIGSAYTKSALMGVLVGIAGGLVIVCILAYFNLKLKADMVLTGIALNTLVSGGTIFLMYMLAGDKGISTGLNSLQVPKIQIPIIKDIPVIGGIFSGHNILTYVAFLSVAVVYIFIYKTPLGLRIRAVGENPDAASSVGTNVVKVKFIALLISGVLASLGGIYMSMGYLPWFSRDMVAGRGFIGIAAQNLGGASPIPTMIAAMVFGVADAMSNILQSLRLPAELIQLMPYAVTLLGLIAYAESKRIRKTRKIVYKNITNKNIANKNT